MSASNRRQPTRSVRTSITRPSNYYARPYGFSGAAAAVDNNAAEDQTPGFFPAITHFTDAIAALPKEVMQHFTLLRETEGKAYAPEQAIAELVNTIAKLPPPPKHQPSTYTQAYMGFSLNNSVNGSATGSMIDGHLPQSRPTTADTNLLQFPHDTHAEVRRAAFFHLRERLREAIGILDEKNMVLTTANETLGKQLSRLEDTLPHVEQEISEEARLGSNTHWALPHMKELRKVTGTSNERARREIQAANNLAAAAAAVAENDLPPTRSETRREAMQAKRKANQNIDSDFDDRPNGRKQASGKVRKTHDIAATVDLKGPEVSILPAQSHKRRRLEKPAPPAMERSVSGIGPTKAAVVKEPGRGREPANGEGMRKKPKPQSMAAATRKRNAANSPSRIQSPSRGTFTTSTAAAAPMTNAAIVRDQSPAPHNPRTAVASRGRQNSTQSLKSVQDRIRNPTTSLLNGKNGTPKASTPELKTAADVTGRTVAEARAALTDAYRNPAGERTLEEEGMSGALVMNPTEQTTNPSRPGSSALKREETEPAEPSDHAQPTDSTPTPQSVPMAMTRSRNGISKPAKATTPGAAAQYSDAATAAPSMARSRSVRGVAASNAAPGNSSPTLNAVGSPRRSHKRGAGQHGPRSLDSPSRSSGSSVDGRNAATATAAALPTGPATAATTVRARAPKQPSSRRSPQRRSGSLSPPRSLSPDGNNAAPNARMPPTGSAARTPPKPAASDPDADNDGSGDAEPPSSPASDEPRYCVCGQVSYGDMIACDNEACPREWFHLQCVGLTKAPGSKAKWFCDECKEMLRRGASARV